MLYEVITKIAWAGRDNKSRNMVAFANAYGKVDLVEGMQFTTRFGFNLSEYSYKYYNYITPENSEPSYADGVITSYSIHYTKLYEASRSPVVALCQDCRTSDGHDPIPTVPSLDTSLDGLFGTVHRHRRQKLAVW